MGSEKRLYILDTNVLMHDPTSIFRFEEHDVLLPMMVLEELDAAKKGLSEVARNVRQVSRFIGESRKSTTSTMAWNSGSPTGSNCRPVPAGFFSRPPCRKRTPACCATALSPTMKS